MIELKPCPYCGGKMRLLGKDPVKIGIVMDCTECYIRVAVPWAYDAEHGIPAFNKRASGWIPCSEKLPELMQYVLCLLVNGEYRVMRRESTNYWQTDFKHPYRGDIITHWMPLPDPPEMNGGCNENHTDDNPELMGGTS